jgi:hypothetical protein
MGKEAFAKVSAEEVLEVRVFRALYLPSPINKTEIF